MKIFPQGVGQVLSYRNGFVLKDCAYCKGGQLIEDNVRCAACEGKGQIKVLDPPMACPRCNGSGHSQEIGLLFDLRFCVICRGTGWVMTEFHIASDDE